MPLDLLLSHSDFLAQLLLRQSLGDSCRYERARQFVNGMWLKSFSIAQTCGPGLEPKQVRVGSGGRGRAARTHISYWPVPDAGISPFFDFSMAIRERERPTGSMIAGWQIVPSNGIVHNHPEKAVVDRISVLINEHPRQGRVGIEYLGLLDKKPVVV